MPTNAFVVCECQDAMLYSQYVILSFKGPVVLSRVEQNSQNGMPFTQCILSKFNMLGATFNVKCMEPS